jgi:hypothetical protein
MEEAGVPDHGQATGKLYQLRLQVELLGNPTT